MQGLAEKQGDTAQHAAFKIEYLKAILHAVHTGTVVHHKGHAHLFTYYSMQAPGACKHASTATTPAPGCETLSALWQMQTHSAP